MAPIDLLHRLKSLKSLYSKESPKHEPAIAPRLAAVLSILFTIIYVLPFYLSKATRPSPQLHRDAPSVIRARIRAVWTSCILTSILTLYVIIQHGHAEPLDALKLLGWWPIAPLEIGKALLLVSILFIGPLFERGIAEGEWRHWLKGHYISEVLGAWIGWRNFVAGPITEELLFRSLLIPLHLLSHHSPLRTTLLTPLYFGIAHIHHFYEFRLTHPHTPALKALARSLFQFAYTSLFGVFAAFLFIRTGSLWPCILAHTFCNWMGLPRMWGRVGVEAGVPLGPPDVRGEGKRDDRRSGRERIEDEGLGVGWTMTYYALLVAGAWGFWFALWPLTESTNALAYF
ncbi:Abi-domain-containing protein [Patellaria atrata CBS 101060]|uniref:intramembrane prenyl-peptidase Rce1 n=1 Tax=Patellaria atrata CBS 101060 TaxID=1346257 RepID=A0A9P4SCU9_9PEZI|nr:Abi-domain-containing protein [Patellaria atrata CBS 101060]